MQHEMSDEFDTCTIDNDKIVKFNISTIAK